MAVEGLKTDGDIVNRSTKTDSLNDWLNRQTERNLSQKPEKKQGQQFCRWADSQEIDSKEWEIIGRRKKVIWMDRISIWVDMLHRRLNNNNKYIKINNKYNK